MKRMISTVGMTHDEWLTRRRSGIGGSDAAAIVHLNPYKSAYSVWADKLGFGAEVPDNEEMRQGRDLEEYVARRFKEETGNRVRRANCIFHDDRQPYMIANVDRLLTGKNEGLECKTMNPRSKYAAALEYNSVPDHYYVQCQWYMAVTGYELWHLAILVFSQGFYTFEIERNDEDIEALRDAARNFWEYNVLGNNPPPPDGSDSCHRAVLSVVGNSNGETVPLDISPNLIKNLQAMEAEKKESERQIQMIKDEIAIALGNAEIGNGDGFRVTMKTQIRRTFDAKKFAKEHPEMDLSGYYKESVSRPFRLRIFEEE